MHCETEYFLYCFSSTWKLVQLFCSVTCKKSKVFKKNISLQRYRAGTSLKSQMNKLTEKNYYIFSNNFLVRIRVMLNLICNRE